MCGISSVVTSRKAVPILLEGIKRLEYRGYDSAGIAVLEDNDLEVVKVAGKVANLEQKLSKYNFNTGIGIAHTRWATHGKPCVENSHPHLIQNRIVIVHNGIIENFEKLKKELIAKNYTFYSETDTEVIGYLIYDKMIEDDLNIFLAVQEIIPKLEGSYALAILDKQTPEQLVVARKNSPLVIGVGIGENFAASDVLALQSFTNKFVFLEDGDVAYLNKEAYYIVDKNRRRVIRDVKINNLNYNNTGKGEYRHFMLKEIFEQPESIRRTICSEIENINLDGIEAIQIVACGTSYYAGLIAKNWIEDLLKIPCNVDIASEFRYKPQVNSKNVLLLTISQSGETADTLAVIRDLGKNYKSTLTICNVPFSSMIRESDYSVLTLAGPEIGVATTKALTSQLVSLFLFTQYFAKQRNIEILNMTNILKWLPHKIEAILKLDTVIKKVAKIFEFTEHALFLGRGIHFPVALEGALKLKEISYIHAEAYPAGELKHGPLALVDKNLPVVVIAPNDSLLQKIKSNIQEVKSRGSKLIIFTNEDSNLDSDETTIVIKLPFEHNILSPIYFTIPLQLLSYHVAILKGTDVDQPRNLAKSVTVE